MSMKDNITDWALEEYQSFYKDNTITKEDVFYYTYGILHHIGYRETYQSFLVRGIPNIPMAPNFKLFEKAGRELADLHLNYETCQKYDIGDPLKPIPNYPHSIRFKSISDQHILIIEGIKIYNNLPVPKYKVNGRTPVGWLTFTPKKSPADIDRAPFRIFTGDEIRAMIERLTYVGLESDRIMEEISKEPFESPNAPKYNQDDDKETLKRFIK